ncbi:MAG: DUF1801 domain-containing protein [Defluviitaleaceae bacterium]|nr:DUF1801 domain-containing protein [Defluviitaleaceae bacterium]
MNEIDVYINGFDGEARQRLQEIRAMVRDVVPDATERICYRMPTFDLSGKVLVHYAAMKAHIGFYPTPEGIVAFENKLMGYKTSKGAVQFPYKEPLPIDLMREIVEYRAAQNQ